MKKIALVAFAFIIFQACTPSESIFVLSPAQSMSITGKGPGQDAAYNPCSNENSLAIIKNLGKNNFDARIQKDGKIIENVTIEPGQKRELELLKGYELYLDSELATKARVNFKKGK